MQEPRKFFEIVGFDVLLNSSLHPHILEVNYNPDAALCE